MLINLVLLQSQEDFLQTQRTYIVQQGKTLRWVREVSRGRILKSKSQRARAILTHHWPETYWPRIPHRKLRKNQNTWLNSLHPSIPIFAARSKSLMNKLSFRILQKISHSREDHMTNMSLTLKAKAGMLSCLHGVLIQLHSAWLNSNSIFGRLHLNNKQL